MYLDDFESNSPVEKKRSTFQTIVAAVEIVLGIFALVSFLFQKELRHYANDITFLTFFGLFALYILFPIPLFRSQKRGEHLLVHFFGFFLAAAAIAIAVQIMPSDEDGRNPLKVMILQLAPFLGILLGASIFFHSSDKATRNVYLQLGLRFLLLGLPLLV